jgi:flagellar hook-basal body complex protein FliE
VTVVPLDRLGLDVAPAGGAATPPAGASADATSFARELLRAFDGAGDALARADAAEGAFAAGRGGLQELVLERARADVALAIASATASRVTQSLGTLLGMQI